MGFDSSIMFLFLWLGWHPCHRSSWTLYQVRYVPWKHKWWDVQELQYMLLMVSMKSQSILFYPWGISQQIISHLRTPVHIYWSVSTFFVYPLCKISAPHTIASSGTSLLLFIWIEISSLPIGFVIMSLWWVSILPVQYQYSIGWWYILEILMNGYLWIGMFFLMGNIAIQTLPGMLVLLLINTLYWKSTSVIVFQCQTCIYLMDQCHVLPQNQKLLLKS